MENHWTKEDWGSIVIISGQDEQHDRPDPNPPRFGGTGFIVQADDENTWVVTCAHVIDELKKLQLLVGDKPAELACEMHPGIDLAVLRVATRLEGKPLILTALHPSSCWIPGWYYLSNIKEWRAHALAATVGRKDLQVKHVGTNQYAWALQVTGFADAEDERFDPRKAALNKGFSGAPVICPTRRAVFAVARQQLDEGEAGYGLCIEHLKAIWPDGAPPLKWREAVDQPVDEEAYQTIVGLFDALPEGLTITDLKRHCQRCAPSQVPLDFPPVNDARAFLNWLIEKGDLENKHVPLFDVLTRIEPMLGDELMRRRVHRICDDITIRYPKINRAQPDPDCEPDKPTGLQIELIDPHSGQQSVKRYDVAIRVLRGENERPQLEDARESRPAERFRPTDKEEIGWLVNDLLERRVPGDVDPDRFTLVFRLPRELLALPVDRWTAAEGDDPLGVLFPVILQDADRHNGKVAKAFWNKSWRAFSTRLNELFPAPLCWCDGTAAQSAPLRTCARNALDNGACIALTDPIDPSDEGERGLLRHLLHTRGAPVLLWPRDEVDASVLSTGLDEVLSGQPLRSLAESLRRLRDLRETDSERPDATAHVTLIWDPPPREERPSLFGTSE